MYSLLLMTAMTTGGDAAAFGHRSGGCYGCCGGVVAYSCSGCCGGMAGYGCCGGSCYGSCSGCWGSYSSCHGCCGGGRGGLFSRFHHHKSCNGCCGGSCYGCCGGYSFGCCGGGCYGSCYGGGAYYYAQGCYGSMMPYGGGCYGGCIGAIPVAPAGPVTIYGADQAVPIAPAPTPAPTTPAPEKKTSANITLELPAAATLYVDGQPTQTTGGVRQFHTPELPAGEAFFYDMKAEVVVDGRTVTEELRVVVHAGDVLSKSFGKLIAAAKGDEKKVAAK